MNIIFYIVILLVFQCADIDYHIDLLCAVLDGSLRLECLHTGVRHSQRETYHCAHLHVRTF